MKQIVKKGLLISILILTGLSGKTQFVKRPVIIETKIHSGMNLPFYKAVTYLIRENIYAFDLSASFPTFGKDYWEKLYRYPRSGIGYSYWSLGNKEVLGNAFALYSFINVPIIQLTEKFSFNYQISLGAAYLSKKFEKYENHLDRAIGSHANLFIRLGLDGKIKLSHRCKLVIEAGTTHFSNGKTRSPNLGINDGSFSVGLNYLIGNNGTAIKEPEISEIRKRFVQTVIYSAGSKTYDNLLGIRYLTSSVIYNAERIINCKSKAGLGAALFYDGSISEALAGDNGNPDYDFKHLIRIGLHVSYTIRYKRIMSGIQIGNYLYSKYKVFTSVYNRVSVQYLLTKNIVASVAVKSHMGKADCMEWGIGYSW